VRNLITKMGRRDASLSAVLALLSGATANFARRVMRFRVAAVHEVAIAGGLIAIGSRLLSIGRGLVVVSPRLISIGEGLISINERLIVLMRRRSRGSGWYWGEFHDRSFFDLAGHLSAGLEWT
jgi:hypothetical protein